MEKLQAESRVIEMKRDALQKELENSSKAAAANLERARSEIDRAQADFLVAQENLKKSRAREAAALREAAKAASAAGRPDEAKRKEREAEGVECLDLPVPVSTIRAVNAADGASK